MADLITVAEAVRNWGISERRIALLCKEGRISGAYKKGRGWVIPAEAERHADGRIKSGTYRKKSRPASLPLPVGVSDYRTVVTDYYWMERMKPKERGKIPVRVCAGNSRKVRDTGVVESWKKR